MVRAWRNAKDLSGTYGIAAVLVVAGLFVAYQFVDPAPPRNIVLATGEDGGAYQDVGQQYKVEDMVKKWEQYREDNTVLDVSLDLSRGI